MNKFSPPFPGQTGLWQLIDVNAQLPIRTYNTEIFES